MPDLTPDRIRITCEYDNDETRTIELGPVRDFELTVVSQLAEVPFTGPWREFRPTDIVRINLTARGTRTPTEPS